MPATWISAISLLALRCTSTPLVTRVVAYPTGALAHQHLPAAYTAGANYTAVYNNAVVSGAIVSAPTIHRAQDVDSPFVTNVPATTIRRRAVDQDVGWGLAYLSEEKRDPPAMNYEYLADSGKGVDVYIIDSGVSKIDPIKDLITDEMDFTGPGTDGKKTGLDDKKNHGTTVAAFVGSAKYGAAKKPNLINCQVMGENGDPSTDAVIAAMKWIIDRNEDRKAKADYRGAIINISFEINQNAEFEALIGKAIGRKITVIASAGNKDEDAAGVFPCSYDDVICVGSMDKDYRRAKFENGGSRYGKALTLFAPGLALTGYDNKGIVHNDLEGSSFATPFVTGIAAIYYGREGSTMTPARVKKLLIDNAEMDELWNVKDSPNALANSGYKKAKDGKPYKGAPSSALNIDPLLSAIGALGSLAATPTTLATSTSPLSPTTTITPPPTESCHTQYKLVLDTFDIWGSNWDASKLGDNGAGLHGQLSGCAEVTKWKFETASDPWQFHASGQITIWQQTCIEHAMVSAGAPEGSQCSGTG
ncbi:hypothetical protein B0A48_16234 [Cryoendolithus antarcticus]|uniref:Peptidase S8/S53 domain-containing protein n=1 Tax=Cryoendolithus antarcticus TaxID=1507870 RepID=A0A1V8SG28_9PEZI|nr:hypothetical protein B0A48_16234 [Cryoendolithus antarcticus]